MGRVRDAGTQSGTAGIDVVIAGFRLLTDEEQERAFATISQLRLERLAGEDGETAKALESMRLVRDHLGEIPTAKTYREAAAELREQGVKVLDINKVMRTLGSGSWRQCREALELSDGSTASQIEARFAKRRLKRVWRYTETSLRETIELCMAHPDLGGRVPQLAELEHWRARELELAKARGEELFLPSGGAYRRRYGTYEKALLALGFTPDTVAERLERK
jgi:hypothetical protein